MEKRKKRSFKIPALMLALTLLMVGCSGSGKLMESKREGPAQTEETRPGADLEAEKEDQDLIEVESEAPVLANDYVVVLDPGHQAKGNYDKEPVGPGSNEFKAKVSSGTAGVATGLAEYELNLQVSLALKEALEARGYTVYLTRETNEVDISNVERAQFASEMGGDIFIRIHADGSESASAQGAMAVCQTPSSPYQDLYDQSRRLSECLLDAYVEATGLAKRKVWETDSMTGNNWAEMPSCLFEMGFMSNPQEDRMMADPDFQVLMVQGLANGVDAYFAGQD